MQRTDPLYITRFVAAMAIVIHHFIPPVFRVEEWGNLFHNFSEGVNYFFFLSGFVMVVAYQKYIFSEKLKFPKVNYWIKRFARIYPIYLLTLLIILSFHFFVQPSFTSVWERLPFELTMVQQWVGFGSINSPAWSISCEVFFYLAFPFIAIRLSSLNGGRLVKAGLKVFGVIALMTVFGYYAIRYNQQHQTSLTGIIHGMLYYHPLLKIITFIAGNLCGVWYLSNSAFLNKMGKYSPYMLAGSILIISAIMFLVPIENASLLNYGLLCPLYFLFVVSICNLSGWWHRTLSSRTFIFLGDISYGVYILQVPVQMFFAKYVFSTNTITGFLIYCAVLVLLSALTYIIIEKPMRKRISSALISQRHKNPALKMSPAN